VRASLLQIDVDLNESVDSRRARVADLVRAQHASDLVVLPELWPLGGFAYDEWSAGAETLDGPTAELMSAAAKSAGVWLHAGSIVERDPDGPIYNTSLLFSPSGELTHTYRKIHRFGFDSGEAAAMGAGTEISVAATDFATLGLATCYDLRFPELFRTLLDAGTEIFVVPAAGTNGGVEQAGHSLVVDPWGVVLAEAGTGEEVLTVDLDPGLVARTRAEFPVLRDRLMGIAAPRR
jgi:predicted amidohydrolase